MKRLRDAIIAGRFDDEVRELRERLAPRTKIPGR